MISYKKASDEKLAELAKSGDEEAYAEIFARYKKTVRIKAKYYYIAGGDPDDTIQEGMIGLFKAVKDYQPDKGASFNSFAQLCIERRIMQAIRDAAAGKNSPLNDSVPIPETGLETEAPDSDNPEDIILKRESAERLEDRLRRELSRMENSVFDLLMDGLNYREIAEILGISSKSADNAIQRIKKKMKIVKSELNSLT